MMILGGGIIPPLQGKLSGYYRYSQSYMESGCLFCLFNIICYKVKGLLKETKY